MVFVSVNIGILWPRSHHIQCLISQQMFYYITFRERCTGIITPGKNTELIYKFWDSQAFSRNSADLDKTTRLLFYICCALVSSLKNSNTPRL